MLVVWIACGEWCARTCMRYVYGISTIYMHGFTITIKKASRQVRSQKLTGRQGQEGKTRATSHQG